LTVENIDMEDRSRIFSPKLDYTCRSVLLTNYLRWQCLRPLDSEWRWSQIWCDFVPE